MLFRSVPADERLFTLFLSSLLGYAAKRGITDLYQGHEAMLADVVQFYMGKAYALGLPFDDYIAERLSIKVRQFNTGLNDPDLQKDLAADALKRKARDHRRGSEGE